MPHALFIHGIANKPEEQELLRIWQRALSRDEGGDPGLNLTTSGIHSSMVYWADVLYESPDEDVAAHESADETAALRNAPDADEAWQTELQGSDSRWMENLAERYGFEAPPPDGDDEFVAPEAGADGTFERVPLPWVIKRRFMRRFVRDTHHYLFNTTHSPRPGTTYQVQNEIRQRFVSKLTAAAQHGSPLVVVSHSMGTVIAYDCLKRVPDCPQVDALVTLGSPLGIDEVQDKLHPGWTREDGFPTAKVAGRWVNVYDPIDIVSRPDTHLANDFRKAGTEVITDTRQDNPGLWTHSITKYLAGSKTRQALRALFALT